MPQEHTYALNLADYVPAPAPLPEPLRPATLAEFPDTATTRRKLYELVRMGVLDTPGHEGGFEPLDVFERCIFGPSYYAEADTQVLALDGEQWVGLSSLRRTDTPRVSSFGLTAVRPEWRGRGVGRALKVHALALAVARGDMRVQMPVSTNPAMRAINAGVGFR